MQIADFTYIVADSAVCQGLPRIKDTRITVSSILAHIAGGMSTSDLLKSFPQLSETAVNEALQFAARHIQEIYLPLKAA
ncbi:MAG: DUF433 domain-containing protein [Spirosomataceae bacterium]